MASQPWEDRRGMFQRGKEVHEPAKRLSQGGVMDAVRRASTSSTNDSAIDKTLSNASSPSSPTSQRRRSSAAAGSAGLFSNLHQHKRGSEDYEARRAGHHDQMSSGGALSGWFNSTFRGMKAPMETGTTSQKTDTNKGTME